MDRIAFSIGKINIYWYAIMICIGMMLAIFLGCREAKRHKLNMDFFINMVFYMILFGIIGTRLYYVLFNLDHYLQNPIDIFKVWNGGLAIHGGIISGILVIIIYTRKYKVNTVKILDISAVSVIIAQAIGRWGNFFNQEAFGSAISRGFLESLHLPKFIIDGMHINGSYYHPTFLYESIWNLIGFVIMLFLRRRKYAKVGEMSGFYLIWYSSARFFIEGLRMDSLMLGPFRIAQIVSIIGIVAGIIFIVRAKKGSKFDNLYNKEEKDETRF